MSMEAFDEFQQAKLQLLRQDIRAGLDDLERGAMVPGDQVFKDLEREFGE